MLKKTQAILALDLLMITIALVSLTAIPSHSTNANYAITNGSVDAEQTDGPGSGSGNTNATGQYTINQSINPGNYTVKATSDGFIGETENTTVANSSDTEVVDFYLNRSGVIEGQVMGSNGLPVVGATVTLHDNSTGSFIDSATTDSDGRYYFATDVDTGAYYAEVGSFYYSFLGPSFSHIEVPNASSGYVGGVRSDTVSVVAGSTTTASTIVLDKSGVITGTVTDGQGNPLANVTVSASSTFFSPYSTAIVSFGFYSTAMSNATGGYSLYNDITNATYSVQPSLNGYVANSVNVTGVEGVTVKQNLTMTSSATLHGTVLRTGDNMPISDVSISLSSDDFTYFGSATTSDNGSYRITTGLGADNYTVTVSLQGQFVNTTSITLSAGQSMTLNFLADAYFINGNVYENQTGGTRVPYPYVDLAFENASLPPGGSTSGDANGTYDLVLPVMAGTTGMPYNGTFTVDAPGYNTTTVNATITVGVDTTMDFVLFKQPPPPPSATIEGTVYGYSGPPLPSSHQVWDVVSGNSTFAVDFDTTSNLAFVSGDITAGYIQVYVWGPEGTTGDMTAMIPKILFPLPSFNVTSIPGPNPTSSLSSNATHWIITIQYGHSSKFITFQNVSTSQIPEYIAPALLVTMLMSGITLVSLTKKRRKQTT
jgi:protocatechuate 3,4-dioxygenase beta subunit